jgi:hypothetical protein
MVPIRSRKDRWWTLRPGQCADFPREGKGQGRVGSGGCQLQG